MSSRPEEISNVIKEQIKNYRSRIEMKETGPFQKAMMWSSIKMNTMFDGSRNHIAEMMVRGTVMGITALRTTKTELPIEADAEIEKLMDELLNLEEEYEKKLKEFL